jgi:AraC-like DNA-binding protein
LDPLSDVLRAVRLDGAFFYLVEASPPWSVSSVGARELIPRVLPGSEHLIAYHILTSGTCWAGLDGESQVVLRPGDVIVFPQGDAHFLSSAQGRHVGPDVSDTSPSRYPATIELGPSAPRDTAFVCGFLGVDVKPYNPLLASLPRSLHVPGIAGGWLSEFPRQVVAESRARGAGSETMLTRMAELMFIEVVRRHLQETGTKRTGWLAGLADPVVGPALAKLHEKPAYPWSLPELAAEVATSRTVLAERFSHLVGLPPMQYLTMWRLQLAAEKLARGSAKVSTVGADVGYESEAAFSRAFKRATGQSPAAWRLTRQAR